MLFDSSVIDVARSAYYRPELLQRNYYLLQQKVLRGPSEWSVAERELFSTFVSTKNQCNFCVAAHSGFASAVKGPEWVRSTLEGTHQDAVNSKINLMLKFLEKLTQQPGKVTSDDIDLLRKQGISDNAIEEAVMVCVVFSIGNRLADSTGIQVATQKAIKRVAPLIVGMGYKLYAM
jgi:uncharacterized peroxidase-related enzyme